MPWLSLRVATSPCMDRETHQSTDYLDCIFQPLEWDVQWSGSLPWLCIATASPMLDWLEAIELLGSIERQSQSWLSNRIMSVGILDNESVCTFWCLILAHRNPYNRIVWRVSYQYWLGNIRSCLTDYAGFQFRRPYTTTRVPGSYGESGLLFAYTTSGF